MAISGNGGSTPPLAGTLGRVIPSGSPETPAAGTLVIGTVVIGTVVIGTVVVGTVDVADADPRSAECPHALNRAAPIMSPTTDTVETERFDEMAIPNQRRSERRDRMNGKGTP